MILIYLQKMEPQELTYCLNPLCVYQQQRVLSRNQSDKLHCDCKGWVIAQQQIADLSFLKTPFQPDAILQFASRPIQTQAYLHFNKKPITDQLVRFLHNIRSDIENILKDLEVQIHDFLENLFRFESYEEIHLLSKQQGVSAELKSLRLAQLLKTPLPLYQDFTLPSAKTSALITSNLRNDIQHLIDFQGIKVTELNELLKRQKNYLNPDQTKIQGIEQEISQVDNKGQCLTMEKEPIKKQDEMSELWEYILKNCNLNTATRLMGEPLQHFYQHQNEGKQSSVKCCYCSFTVKLKTRSKAQTNSACSYAILQHLYKEHTSSILYQYSFLKGSFSSNSFHLLLQKIANPKMLSVTIIDTSSLFNVKKLFLEESSFAFEIIFGRNKPLFKNEFMRGGNPKDIMMLIGLLVSYASILCKKKVIIYTSDQRSETINKACKFYGFENVTALSGTQSTEKGVEVLKKVKQTPTTKFQNDL